MNIAIITEPLSDNYGGILQNFALQHVLKEMGHHVITIRHKNIDEINTTKIGLTTILFNSIKSFFGNFRRILIRKPQYMWYWVVDKDMRRRRENCELFISKYITVSQNFETIQDINDFVTHEIFDCFIVGSDQVWRPCYNVGYLYFNYLDFISSNNIKRIAYATSFGTSDFIYTEDQIKRCKSLINKFDAVSVREESALKYCNDLFSYDKAKLVLDPTLLLNRTVYESLTKSDRDVNRGKLFCYILDNNEKTQDVIYDLCKAINIKASYVLPRYGRKRNFRHQNTICSVQSFLISLMNAKYVLTDSFHGCVFSIIFNKPFVCIGNEYRGNDRFLTLQKLFNIESRFTNKNDVESIKLILDKDLDWNQINNFKKHYVEESIKFIESSLNYQ